MHPCIICELEKKKKNEKKEMRQLAGCSYALKAPPPLSQQLR